jgi:hypothetical protein
MQEKAIQKVLEDFKLSQWKGLAVQLLESATVKKTLVLGFYFSCFLFFYYIM